MSCHLWNLVIHELQWESKVILVDDAKVFPLFM